MIKSIPLCSRCAMHEISSWFWEKSNQLEPEVLRQISLELRAIRLEGGSCLVCGNKQVAGGCFENILKILEKSKYKEIKNEFTKLFGICI